MTTSNTYDNTSPYFNTQLAANGAYLGLWTYRSVPFSRNDKIITISSAYNMRPDLLAHDLFGDSRLWWVFAVRNPNTLSTDPLGNFLEGVQIYIPDATTLKSNLGII